MKTALIFDSYFGNTEKIARAIADAFTEESEFVIKRSNDVNSANLVDFELLIVGSPTRGFQPTEGIAKLIKAIPKNALQEVKLAAFDTRLAIETINSTVLKKIVHIGGYAAKPIAKRLVKKGAQQIIEPEGFYVVDTEGPLKENELERATAWGKSILESCS